MHQQHGARDASGQQPSGLCLEKDTHPREIPARTCRGDRGRAGGGATGDAIAGVLHPYRGRGIAAGWALGLAALSAIAAVQWLVMSLYTLGAADWTPLLRAAALAVLAFPVLDLLLAPFAARPRPLASGYLVRGG